MKIKESNLRRSIRMKLIREQSSNASSNKNIVTWFDTAQTKKDPNLKNEKKFQYMYNVSSGDIKIINNPSKPSVSTKNPMSVNKDTAHYKAILDQYNKEVKGKKNENK